MLTFDEARARLLAGVAVLGPERVALADAPGRVLAADVRARGPLPAFDYSAMDGYAVATGALPDGAGSFELAVAGESRAGGPPPPPLAAGGACRVFTGAPIPAGADAVVMQEDVAREGDRARFAARPAPGQYVRRAGEDLAAGALALARGTRLAARHVGLLAALGRTDAVVARRPRVSVLCTGDELRDPVDAEPARPGSVIDANGPAVAALARACGAGARRVPVAPDEPAATRAALAAALDGADVVVSVGGVSVGAHDLVLEAAAAAGVALDFWRVAIKPGKPLAVGRAGAKYFLGLPGNPASAAVTFALFAAPLLRALQGDLAPVAPAFLARLAAPVAHATGRTEFLRATLAVEGEGWVARVLPNQASGAPTAFAWADALVVLPADVAALPAGAPVRVVRLADV